MAQANPTVWADTAIIVTVDEGGGYWDSGYIQPVDFFGDGPRIPFIVVSKASAQIGIVHTYCHDHACRSISSSSGTGAWKQDDLPAQPR